MEQHVRKANGLRGVVTLPADKSIAHRAAILAALGEGTSRIVNYPTANDPQSTLTVLRALGVQIEEKDGILEVIGRGLNGLEAPSVPLDCGNSGTTMRLMAGVLAGQPFGSILVGDASLSRRPMGRVVGPLEAMGARIHTEEGHAPIRIEGGTQLKGITYSMPVPSAQVKSCLLLAGHFAEGTTTVVESLPSRDHTERMLGLDVLEMDGQRHLSVTGGRRIPAATWTVPRDFSAAAFFMVAACLVPGARLEIPAVGLNPTRSALLDVLRAMGARIQVQNERSFGGETLADLAVSGSDLQGVRVGGSIIPNLIDEIPILAVAGALAKGVTEIRDAAELRVKETDRIAAMTENLRAMGAEVESFEDGMVIYGGRPLKGARVAAFDDHRIAMAMAIAGLVAEGETVVEGADAAAVSFPDFWDQLSSLRES